MKILIVDDSLTILLSMEAILTKAGHIVVRASSGEQALTHLQGTNKPDVMITDLHMPGMDGITLVRATRKLTAYRFMPILFLTTESQQAKRTEAKAAGATGWLVKPVAPLELLSVLQQVCPK